MVDQHLIEYNEAERADYLAVVASMAGVDGSVSSEEILALQQLCRAFVLGPEARGRVMAATTAGTEDLDVTLDRLATTNLRHALVLDLCMMAWRDGQLLEAEESEIRRMAEKVGVSSRQVAILTHFASSLRQGADLEQSLTLLESSGVPRSALALSATLLGMDRTGHTLAHQTREAL